MELVKCQIAVEEGVIDSWRNIGVSENLTTDTDIANFLVWLYYNGGLKDREQSGARCGHCHTPLTLYCTVCQQPSSQARPSHAPPSYLPQALPSHAASDALEDLDIDSKLSLVSLIREHEESGQIVSLEDGSVPFQRGLQVDGDDFGSADGGLGEQLEPEGKSAEPETDSAVGRSSGVRRGNAGARRIQENGFSSPMKKMKRRTSASRAGRRRKGKKKDTTVRTKSSSLLAKQRSGPKQLSVSLTRCDQIEKQDQISSQLSKDKRYSCSTCEKSFDEVDKLDSHRRYNHGPFVCAKCGKSYNSGCSYYFHIRTKCKPDNSFECDLCGAVYRLERNLIRHKKQSHLEDNSLKCKKCSFKCSAARALRNHMKKHERGQNAQCEYCGMHLRKESLKAHILVHKGEKPHQCTKCERTYRSIAQLRAHMKSRHSEIEKPFRCDQCCRGFLKADTLKYHIFSHTGEKPYKCTMCPSVFVRKDYLNKHIRTHTGEKPYRCSQCEEKFAYPNSLKAHRQKLHGAAGNAEDKEPVQLVPLNSKESHRRVKEDPQERGEEEPRGRTSRELKGRAKQVPKRYVFLQPGGLLPFLPVSGPKSPEIQSPVI